MIRSVLIANRGEIACRIIRTARRLGVRSVAVYSDADAGAKHVREADEAVHIGPSPARESYLVGEKIIAAAKARGAEAIHPGYGFLSENAAFAEAVAKAGLIWVGPPPAAIRAMGLKDSAKKRMADAGVPVTPGYLGEDQSEARLAKEAGAIGYPVLIKAVAGGGGKGMRKVERAGDFAAALGAAQREAKAAFGDDRVLLETYVQRPRHIEVQVFADAHGNVVHLFERDCSLQRRHQKVIEEAPAPGMDEETRAAVCGAAVKAAAAVGYVGAGTVEFIADGRDGLRGDRIWFMEMNTRLQVEHPVTEAITGVDLVEWQLRVASGEKLPLAQSGITRNGWAMEARLYAENPATGFLPSTGLLAHLKLPGGVRVDAGVDEGDAVTPFYDPMIAKIIAHAPTRAEAAAKLAAACATVEVAPVKTNAAFLARALAESDFVNGAIDTGFIEGRLEALAGEGAASAGVLQAAARAFVASGDGPWSALAGFRLNAAPEIVVRLEDGAGIVHDVRVGGGAAAVTVLRDGARVTAFDRGLARVFTPPRIAGADEDAIAEDVVRAPMPGRIVSVSAKAGDAVKAGAPLVTLEAMKMEHVLNAPFAGKVAELRASAGAQVTEGAVLVVMER